MMCMWIEAIAVLFLMHQIWTKPTLSLQKFIPFPLNYILRNG
jgi:hypothetical protein